MEPSDETVERRIARLVHWTHGITRKPDLEDLGITEGEIRHRRQSGLLICEYPGIYRVGHRALCTDADYLAAVWACGDGAYLFGDAAIHHYGLTKGEPPKPHIAAPGRHQIDGIVHRQSRVTHPRDLTEHRRIPVTTVPRTLVDITTHVDEDELARLCHLAGILFKVSPDAIESVLARRPNTPGVAKLRRVLYGEIPSRSQSSSARSSPFCASTGSRARWPTAASASTASTAAGSGPG